MTTTTTNPLLSTGLFALGFARGVTTRLLDSIPEDKWDHRPAGGTGNHALWIMGHLATTDAQFLEAGQIQAVGFDHDRNVVTLFHQPYEHLELGTNLADGPVRAGDNEDFHKECSEIGYAIIVADCNPRYPEFRLAWLEKTGPASKLVFSTDSGTESWQIDDEIP